MSVNVVSWNLLAPVWAHRELYPGVPSKFLDVAERRGKMAREIKALKPSVLLLQEAQEDELPLLLKHMAEEEGQEEYECHFAPSPPEVWATWAASEGPAAAATGSTGVAIVWRRSFFTGKPTHVDVRLGDTAGIKATAVVGAVAAWGGQKVVFACSHLGQESTALGRAQAGVMASALASLQADHRASHVVWGGDFSAESHSPLMQDLAALEYRAVSDMHGCARIHTVMTTAGSSRIDHVLVKGPPSVSCVEAAIPQCPLPYILGKVPLLTARQWLTEDLAPAYRANKAAFLALLLPVALVFVAFLTLEWVLILLRTVVVALGVVFYVARTWSMQSLDRTKWCLESYGSDHLPVRTLLTYTQQQQQQQQQS